MSEAKRLSAVFARQIEKAMESRRINRSELARLLRVDPAYVTQFLRGKNNLTLASMAKIAKAVGMGVECQLYEL